MTDKAVPQGFGSGSPSEFDVRPEETQGQDQPAAQGEGQDNK
jgi:hypothetical protein